MLNALKTIIIAVVIIYIMIRLILIPILSRGGSNYGQRTVIGVLIFIILLIIAYQYFGLRF